MSIKAFFFTDPASSIIQLVHDNGTVYIANQDTHPTGRPGQSITFPNDIPFNSGVSLTISSNSKVPVSLRGILIKSEDNLAYVLCDDFRLTSEKICPEIPIPPEPNPPQPSAKNPLALINLVYSTGLYDLSTKEGCGKFTEACCEELHDLLSASYGHLKKIPPQNNYNGHAVDAVNLLIDYVNSDGSLTRSGIYDIIFSTESPEAKPVFNRAGDAKPELWYYPA